MYEKCEREGLRAVLLIVLCALALTTANTQTRAEFGPQSVTDMIAVSQGAGAVVYVSDSESGGIYFYAQPFGADGPIEFNQFKLLWKADPKYRRLAGLEYQNGYLYVVDQANGSVIKINPRDPEKDWQSVDLPLTIKKPEHIAFSGAGVLAVASDRGLQYLYSKTDAKLEEAFENTVRIFFDGRSLLALDENGPGDIFAVDSQPGLNPTNSLKVAKVFNPELRANLPRMEDFVFYRGIYYVVSRKKILAFSRSQTRSKAGAQPLPLDLPKGVNDISRIAVSENSIYIAQRDQKTIWRVPRAVPVLVDFPRADANTVSELSRITEAVDKLQTLSTQTIKTERSYDTVNDLARDQLFSGASDFQGGVNASVTASFAELICSLNKFVCERNPSSQAVTKQGDPVGSEFNVVIPNLKIKFYSIEKVIEPTGGSNDLSSFLTEMRIVPLSLDDNSLNAGHVIKVDDAKRNKPSKLHLCEEDSTNRLIRVPAAFPAQLFLTVEEFVSQIGLPAGATPLLKSGVANIVASYEEVQYEKHRTSLTKAIGNCLESFNSQTDPSVYAVDRVLFAASANYKFLDRNGKTLTIDPKLLSSAKVGGQLDFSMPYIWFVRNRLNLGYVGVRFSSTDQGGDPPKYLEPTQKVEKQLVQQLTLLIEAEKIPSTIRTLNGLADASKVQFYSAAAQDLVYAGQEKSLNSGALPVSVLSLDEAKAKRDRLRELIKFPSELSDLNLSQTLVGIVEDPGTIEDRHQCFFSDSGDWSWGESQSVETSEAISTGVRVAGRVKTGNEFNSGRNGEHGTHVAGIIGAKSFLPGLTPSVRLVRIDPTRLLDEMTSNANKVQLYNFSIYLEGTDSHISKLLRLLVDGQIGEKKILMIVAAGNEKINFGDLGVTPPRPVSWLSYFPNNIIVVAASQSDRAALLNKSNFSKKYVQLMAPGEDIYSATKNNTYAPATGTSQAAPQVTAVAALLRSKNLSAQWIKAVLLYTANWNEDLMEDVWAGMLDAKAALDVTSNVGKNLVKFSSNGPMVAIAAPVGQHSIKIHRGEALINDPNVPKEELRPTSRDLTIPFGNVLRIQQLNETGLFRIIYLDEDARMTMLYRAKIESPLPCRVLKDQQGNPLVTDVCPQKGVVNGHDAKIEITKVHDYMRRSDAETMQPSVNFPPPKCQKGGN